MLALATTTLFWVFFTMTLGGLVGAIVTGLRGFRRVHLYVAPTTLVLLTVTIVLAEQMGRARTFPPDEMAIHLVFAKSAAGLVLPVIFTGLALLRFGIWRRAHLVCVGLFILVALMASATGIWVFGLSTE